MSKGKGRNAMLQSPVFPSQTLEEEFARWLEKKHPGRQIYIAGYYIPFGGGVVIFFELD